MNRSVVVGWAQVVVGGAILSWCVFSMNPWMLGVLIGGGLVVAGGIRVVDGTDNPWREER